MQRVTWNIVKKIFEKETKFKKDPLSELEDNGEIRGFL